MPDPLNEKKILIENILNQFGDAMDSRTRKNLLESLKEDTVNEQEEEKPTLVESLAELTRLLAVLAALFALMIFQQKDKYSGRDLTFSNEPPEVDDNDPVGRLTFGEDNQKSWKKFTEEVGKLPEMSFSEFMNKVLEANARNTARSFKLKRKELNRKLVKLHQNQTISRRIVQHRGRQSSSFTL